MTSYTPPTDTTTIYNSSYFNTNEDSQYLKISGGSLTGSLYAPSITSVYYGDGSNLQNVSVDNANLVDTVSEQTITGFKTFDNDVLINENLKVKGDYIVLGDYSGDLNVGTNMGIANSIIPLDPFNTGQTVSLLRGRDYSDTIICANGNNTGVNGVREGLILSGRYTNITNQTNGKYAPLIIDYKDNVSIGTRENTTHKLWVEGNTKINDTLETTGQITTPSIKFLDNTILTSSIINANQIANGSISDTEFETLNNIRTNIQTQIDDLQTQINNIPIPDDNINANQIANGSISNTEFETLNNIRTNIQTQIDDLQTQINNSSSQPIVRANLKTNVFNYNSSLNNNGSIINLVYYPNTVKSTTYTQGKIYMMTGFIQFSNLDNLKVLKGGFKIMDEFDNVIHHSNLNNGCYYDNSQGFIDEYNFNIPTFIFEHSEASINAYPVLHLQYQGNAKSGQNNGLVSIYAECSILQL